MKSDLIQELKRETAGEDLDLSWLDTPAAERGLRIAPSKRGLTLEEISTSSYGDIPTQTANQSGRLRGSGARNDSQRTQQLWNTKAAVWSESAMLLYEEAVQRQWSSATDIPWADMPDLPEELELAMSQLCTFLTQVEFIAGDVPGQYAPNVSGEYFEVGLFLASQIMDEARHLDVFRKRALSNGIGLLKAGPGAIGLLTAQDFTEMASTLHLVGEGFVQSMFRMGELFAQSEVDKRMFRLAAQDESRHVAFGVMHMKYVMETQPDRREEIHTYLDRMEGNLGAGSTQAGLTGGGETGEALAILLGGGTTESQLRDGYGKLLAIRKRQVNEYMHRLEVVGLGDRRQHMNPFMAMLLDPPKN
ncbi:MAG: ferritin-like domain-containing protein [Chloroflexi bacterium]|nr:ferritin-like domain-containing protein [Chloroflexota bacterium]